MADSVINEYGPQMADSVINEYGLKYLKNHNILYWVKFFDYENKDVVTVDVKKWGDIKFHREQQMHCNWDLIYTLLSLQNIKTFCPTQFNDWLFEILSKSLGTNVALQIMNYRTKLKLTWWLWSTRTKRARYPYMIVTSYRYYFFLSHLKYTKKYEESDEDLRDYESHTTVKAQALCYAVDANRNLVLHDIGTIVITEECWVDDKRDFEKFRPSIWGSENVVLIECDLNFKGARENPIHLSWHSLCNFNDTVLREYGFVPVGIESK